MIVFCVIVVPAGVLVTVINRDICPIDPEELAERNLLGKFVDQLGEYVFSDEFEVSDEP